MRSKGGEAMGEVIPVSIEQYSENPKKFKIICCDGGVVTRAGCVELQHNNAIIFEGEDGYEQAVRYIDESPRFLLQ